VAALLTDVAALPGMVCGGLKQIHAQEQYLKSQFSFKMDRQCEFWMRTNFELKFNLEV